MKTVMFKLCSLLVLRHKNNYKTSSNRRTFYLCLKVVSFIFSFSGFYDFIRRFYEFPRLKIVYTSYTTVKSFNVKRNNIF